MPTTKQCSKCKASFECKNDATECWCTKFTLSADALQHLKDNYENCLCPDCLATYTTQELSAYPLIP